MAEPPSENLEPRFVTCLCEHCHGGIEFDVAQLGGRSALTISCPHCAQETTLQEPPPPPPLVPEATEAPAPTAEPEPIAPLPPPPTRSGPPASPAAEPSPPPDPKWQTDLGVAHYRQTEFEEAFNCFLPAARQGFSNAQFCVAVCYFNGQGTPRNEREAVHWLRLAAAQGYVNAEFVLGTAFALGRGAERDQVEAAAWFRKAAVRGHAPSAASLADCLASGEGLKADLVEAHKWMKVASSLGLAGAETRCRELIARMTEAQFELADPAEFLRRKRLKKPVLAPPPAEPPPEVKPEIPDQRDEIQRLRDQNLSLEKKLAELHRFLESLAELK
jgi:hypothetical protein